eukprot:Skav221651  [mRNA]  locus=scaffold1174:334187:337306:- [translate_table: standard]
MIYEPLQIEEWKRHAKAVNAKSARGCCAYTPKELIMMPDALTQWLLDILNAIECDRGDWPKTLMRARVVMLGKTEHAPTNPLQVRPITIASRICRNWARYRAMQAICHFQNHIPAAIGGTVSSVSADMVAALVLDSIEQSFEDDSVRCGVTVDLVKCYNSIPRKPVLAAMCKMGVCREYLRALEGMFRHLERYLELAGQIDATWKSTTGVPEGCCFSIIAMLALTMWVTSAIQFQTPDLQCVAYADNWAILGDDLDKLLRGLNVLCTLVEQLGMKIANDKSWVWSTSAGMRRRMRQLHQQGQLFALRLVHADLGCDISYSKKITKVTAKKRLAKANRVLQRVGRKKIPKKFKNTMHKQLSIGIVGHGSEFTFYTPAELKSLRANSCKAIGRSRGGVSPYLALTATGDAKEPELALAIRKCFFWRRFFRVFPHLENPFLDRTALEDFKSKTGPACVFQKTMKALGWDCLPHGVLQHEHGFRVQWLRCSKGFLQRTFQLAWNLKACVVLQDRKGFDLQCMHLRDQRILVSKQTGASLTDCIQYMTGKHITNDALCHYAHGTSDDKCPLCGKKDGRAHRIHHCTELAHVRKGFGPVLRWLVRMPQAVANFGVLPYEWQHLQTDIVDLSSYQIPCFAEDDWVHVFTDGSCYFSHDFCLARAAGAWICSDGTSVIKSGFAMLPGSDHTPFRAEIWAIILVLQRYKCVTFHVDCMAAIQVLDEFVTSRRHHSVPSIRDHWDLWSVVWALLQHRDADDICIRHIKSHQTISEDTTAYERWRIELNNQVDEIAKQTVLHVLGRKHGFFVKIDKDHTTNGKLLEQFHEMWHQMNQCVLSVMQKKKVQRETALPTFTLPIDESRLVTLNCKLEEGAMQTCPLGSIFAKRIIRYFHGLRWDPDAQPVSLLELYIDFSCWTNTLVPVLLDTGSVGPRGGKIMRYELPDLHPGADQVSETLAIQMRAWTRAVKWLHAIWKPDSIPTIVTNSRTTHRYGFPEKRILGLTGHPVFRTKLDPCLRLWKFFHTSSGAHRSLKRVWSRSHAVAAAGG